MEYILQETYVNPCFIINRGESKTEEEWMKIFPNLQKGDCEIKTDWFKKNKFYNYTYKVFIGGQEAQLSDNDTYDFLMFLIKERQYRLIANQMADTPTIVGDQTKRKAS